MPSLDRGGWSLHYEVAGEDSEHDKRSPVLLVQGCGVAGEGWRPQLATERVSRRGCSGSASACSSDRAPHTAALPRDGGARDGAEAAHGVTIQKAEEITELLREHVAAAEQRRRAA